MARPEAWLDTLRDECIALWRSTRAELPSFGNPVAWHRQWRNARATSRLIDEVATRILTYPRETAERRAWRDSLRRRVLEVAGGRFGWPSGYARLAFGEAFYDTALAFAREARRVDPALSLDDLGQALRNVWIANTLQMITGRPVRLTAGLFAYSMLYPATDNLLDDMHRPASDKRAFNARLGLWLSGGRAEPADHAERRVRALVGRIEQEFPRNGRPDVWAAVLAIHRAQVDSLRQQSTLLPEPELLALTVAKGGASVLADLTLASAGGDPPAARFAFRYGVFLQMLDDLQDVGQDLAAGHETLFTRAARRGTLDTLAGRLARFMDLVLDRDGVACSGADADCLDLIRRNCRALIVGVIAREPHRFSPALRRRVEREWPVTLGATRRLQRRARRRAGDVRRELQARFGMASPLDWLLDNGQAPHRTGSQH